MIDTPKNALLSLIVMACLASVMAVVLLNIKKAVPQVPLTGVEAFVKTCSVPGEKNADCASSVAIQKAFGFDLMSDINDQYKKMKKTAADIASGSLTDDAYKSCLSAGTCAAVPMLDDDQEENTPQAKQISRTFWELADGHYLSLGVCKFMPVCSTALLNGLVTANKNRIVAAKAKKS